MSDIKDIVQARIRGSREPGESRAGGDLRMWQSACCGQRSDHLEPLRRGPDLSDLRPRRCWRRSAAAIPTALAELKPGEVVLDLGSGGGIDVLLSARRVGPTGKAYGLDMTDEMLRSPARIRRSPG